MAIQPSITRIAAVPGAINLAADDLALTDIVKVDNGPPRSAQSTLEQIWEFLNVSVNWPSYSVGSVAALKSLLIRPSLVATTGYFDPSDGGGGPPWVWVAGDTTTPDDFLVVQPTFGTPGRYIRLMMYGSTVSPKWAGVAFGDEDSERFQVVLDADGAHAIDTSGCTILLGETVTLGYHKTCPKIFGTGKIEYTGSSTLFALMRVYKSDFCVDGVFWEGDISKTAGVAPKVGRLLSFEGTFVTVSGITNASAAVVTCNSTTDLRAGLRVAFTSVSGMTEINGNNYEIEEVLSGTTFRVAADTTSFSAYTSGGFATLEVARQRAVNGRFKGGGTGVEFRSASGNTDMWFQNNNITDTWGDGTVLQVVRNAWFQNNHFEDCGYDPASTDSVCHFTSVFSQVPTENLIVSGNTVKHCIHFPNPGTNRQEAMDFAGLYLRNCVISNNIIDDVLNGGFEFKPPNTGVPPGFYGNVSITENLVNFRVMTANITNITQDATGDITLEAPGVDWPTGIRVYFSGIEGMTELNGRFATFTKASDTTGSIDIDTSGFGAYTGGGTMTYSIGVGVDLNNNGAPNHSYLRFKISGNEFIADSPSSAIGVDLGGVDHVMVSDNQFDNIATLSTLTGGAGGSYTISSGTYDNGTGVIALTVIGTITGTTAGDMMTMAALTGTGAFASFNNGEYEVISVVGQVITLQGDAAMGASSFTGGSVGPDFDSLDVSIINNTASLNGVAISNGLTIDGLTVSGNTLSTTGGILFDWRSGFPMYNVKIVHNPLLETTLSTAGSLALSNIQSGEIAWNTIKAPQASIDIGGSVDSANLDIHDNEFTSSSNDAIDANAAAATVQVYRNHASIPLANRIISGTDEAVVARWNNTRDGDTTDPNGVVAGSVGDVIPNTDPGDGFMGWVCTAAGSTTTAVWIEFGSTDLQVVDTVADLKALKQHPDLVTTIGYADVDDGAGGPPWRWAAGSTATPDDFSVVEPDDGANGRWIRILPGMPVSPKWGGVGLGETDDTVQFQKVVDYGAEIDIGGCDIPITPVTVGATGSPRIFGAGRITGAPGTSYQTRLLVLDRDDFHLDGIEMSVPIVTDPGASYNASYNGTAMTVTSAVTGTILTGQVVFATGVPAGTTIQSGAGVNWVLSASVGVLGSRATESITPPAAQALLNPIGGVRLKVTNCFFSGGVHAIYGLTDSGHEMLVDGNDFVGQLNEAIPANVGRSIIIVNNHLRDGGFNATSGGPAGCIRAGVSTNLELMDNLIIADNVIERWNEGLDQEAIDCFTANILNVLIFGNDIDQCGNGGIECKTNDDPGFYESFLIALNNIRLPATGAIGITLGAAGPALSADRKNSRVLVAMNQITGVPGSTATGISVGNWGYAEISFNKINQMLGGILLGPVSTPGSGANTAYDIDILSNVIDVTGVGIQQSNSGVALNTSGSTAAGTTLPFASTTGVVVGQAVTGTNIAPNSAVASFVVNTSVTLTDAILGTVGAGEQIKFGRHTVGLRLAGNRVTSSGSFAVQFAGDTVTNLTMTGNILESLAATQALDMRNIRGGLVAYNIIKTTISSQSVYSQGVASVNLRFESNDITSGAAAIRHDTGSVVYLDNRVDIPVGSRSFHSSSTGVTAAMTKRGLATTNPSPTSAGSIGDVYYNSTPGAGLPSYWECITAGAATAAIYKPVGGIPGAPVTVAAGTYTVLDTDTDIICNNAGGVVLTLPAQAYQIGRRINISTITADAVTSASSNVVPRTGGAAGTGILPATDGACVTLVCSAANTFTIMSGTP